MDDRGFRAGDPAATLPAMRVLFVHDRCGEQGGAEANVRLSAAGLAARGCACALLHGSETGTAVERFRAAFDARFAWDGGVEAAVDAALAWRPDVVYAHKVAEPRVLARIVASRARLVRMVHDHELYCQRGSRYFPWNRKPCRRRAGYGCVVTCGVVRDRGGPLPIRLAWPGALLRALELARRCDRALVASAFMRDELVLHGFAPERIAVLPIGARAVPDAELSAHEEPLALYVGQLLRGKGVDVALRAFARLPADTRLAIVGDGPHRAACEALTRDLGVGERVRFHGWMPQESLGPLYRRARAAIVPSLWPEPMGMVGPEAMHRALPVVAFDVGGVREWLDHGVTGVAVPWNDVAGFADALGRLLGDRDAAVRLGRAGLERARGRFTVDRYLDDLRDVLAATAAARAA